MRTRVRCCLGCLIAFMLLATAAHAAPTTNDGVRWRIAYYEGGPWVDYQGEFIALVDGLVALGWIEPFTWPPLSSPDDVRFLWGWLSANARSDFVEFVIDAFWSAEWDSQMRSANRADAIHRLATTGDIDLVLALGTWAGIDLANDEHSVPTLVMSTNNPIQAGIIRSAGDSGLDHIHARTDPDRYIRQLTVFHNMIGFERLGILYDDTPEGRTFAVLDDAETVARQMGFELVTCIAPDTDVTEPQAVENAAQCLGQLAPRIDAFLITSHLALTAEHLPNVLTPLFEHKVPTWALEGPDLVQRGALMAIQRAGYGAIGDFQASNVDAILNGARPRDLNQVFEEPKSIALNLEAARRIGFEIPPGLIAVADAVYDEIEGERP